MVELHRDELAIYRASLKRRVDRLARLVATPENLASPALLSMFVGQLLRAAVPLCGKELSADLLEWLGRQLRETYGLCVFCGATKEVGALMCPECTKEMEDVDREILFGQADEAAPQ